MTRTIQLAVAALLALVAPAMAQDIKVGTIFPLSGGAGPDVAPLGHRRALHRQQE